MISVEICCNTCKNKKTMNCPNSSECYSLENKPHWIPIDVECEVELSAIKKYCNIIKKMFK